MSITSHALDCAETLTPVSWAEPIIGGDNTVLQHSKQRLSCVWRVRRLLLQSQLNTSTLLLAVAPTVTTVVLVLFNLREYGR